MKYTIIVAALLLISCKEDKFTNTKEEVSKAKDTIASPRHDSSRGIYIKDKSQYSPEWLAAIEKSGYNEPLKIIDNYILIDKDTAYFPEELKQNAGYHFTAFTDKHFYQLDVTRINLTTVEYDFTLMENESAVVQRNGKAHLSPLFFLGDETFTDEEEESVGYLATEYHDDTPGGLTVDIGEPDRHGRVRANIKGLPANVREVVPNITLRQSL